MFRLIDILIDNIELSGERRYRPDSSLNTPAGIPMILIHDHHFLKVMINPFHFYLKLF
jgi:hypothetical protein